MAVSVTPATMDVLNPATGEVLAGVPRCGPEASTQVNHVMAKL